MAIQRTVYDLIEILTSSITLLFIIFAFHYQILYVIYLRNKKQFKYYSTAFLTLLMIPFGGIFVFVEIIGHALNHHIPQGSKHTVCWLYYVTSAGSMTIMKMAAYFALTARIIESYGDTGIYSKTGLKIWQWYLFVSPCFTATLAFTCFEFEDGACHNKIYPDWVIAVFGFHEFSTFVGNIILFTKPLCQLIKLVESMKGQTTSKEESDHDIHFLIRKTSILGILSVITSVFAISMIPVVPIAEFWMSLDIMATITCIILLFKRNQPIFDCLCCCLMGKYANSEKSIKGQCLFGCETLLELSREDGGNYRDQEELAKTMGSKINVSNSSSTPNTHQSNMELVIH